MAHILSSALGGKAMMAFWYHFAILFEALFILTAVDAGTRAGRFMLQDLLGTFVPSMRKMDSIFASLVATGLCVAAWGYFLYQGVVDRWAASTPCGRCSASPTRCWPASR
jgi:carbon starvation protein